MAGRYPRGNSLIRGKRWPLRERLAFVGACFLLLWGKIPALCRGISAFLFRTATFTPPTLHPSIPPASVAFPRTSLGAMRRLGLLFLFLFFAPLAFAQGAEARFKAFLGETLAVRSVPPSEGATLHPLFLSLETLPDGAAASAALRERVRAGIATPDLRATATALCLLQLALEGRMADHADGFAAFQTSGAPEAFVSQANARTATVPCPTYAGRRWVCPACRGIVLCMACGGRGNGFRRAEGFALTEAKRIPCATCGGSGLCRACRGVRKVCPTCRDVGTVISPERLRDRISRLAGAAARRTQRCAEEETAARTQTETLALALSLCREIPAPTLAVAHLRALRGKRLERAAQWPCLPALLAAAEAWEAEAAAEANPPPTQPSPAPAVTQEPPAVEERPAPAVTQEPPTEQARPASLGEKPSVQASKPRSVDAVSPPTQPPPAPAVVQEPPTKQARPAPTVTQEAPVGETSVAVSAPVFAEKTASAPWGWMAAGVFAFLVLYVLGAVLLTARRGR